MVDSDPETAFQTPAVLVSTLAGVARFCRAGRCFGPEPTRLTADELSPDQLALLRAEKNLVVVDASAANAPAADAPPEAS